MSFSIWKLCNIVQPSMSTLFTFGAQAVTSRLERNFRFFKTIAVIVDGKVSVSSLQPSAKEIPATCVPVR